MSATDALLAVLAKRVSDLTRGFKDLSKQPGPKGDKGDPGASVKGDKGDPGRKGDKGDKGDQGDPGPKGDKGDKGDPGKDGAAPDHKWEGTKLKFQKPDGTWGKAIDLRGPKGDKGDPGKNGRGGVAVVSEGGAAAVAAGGVFITDIEGVSGGIVGQKTYNPGTVPANATIAGAVSDSDQVRVHVAADGTSAIYSPTVTVNGQPVTLVESSTKRWFTGSVVITIDEGTTTITAASGDVQATASVVRAGEGPEVNSIEVGAFPGTQTALKSGDTVLISVTTDPEAVTVTITGPVTAPLVLPVVAGAASGTVTIGAQTGFQQFSAVAKNALGTAGDALESISVLMDQVYPTFGAITVAYPSGQTALNTGETATFNCVISGATSASYGGTGLVVTDPNTLANSKTVGHSLIGFHEPVLAVTAMRAANGAISSTSRSIRVATVAPQAAVTTSPAGRMTSSPSGNLYTVRITPDQPLLAAPTMNASGGTWEGSWTTSTGNSWVRSLRILDSTARGSQSFSALAITGPAGIPGDTISSGAAYTVGGFSSRTLTIPAFSRVVAIGTAVAQTNKLTAQIAGGNTLALKTDNAVVQGGFYPANADGSYNATGEYIGLSDTALAGANSSGTLQIIVAEAA